MAPCLDHPAKDAHAHRGRPRATDVEKHLACHVLVPDEVLHIEAALSASAKASRAASASRPSASGWRPDWPKCATTRGRTAVARAVRPLSVMAVETARSPFGRPPHAPSESAISSPQTHCLRRQRIGWERESTNRGGLGPFLQKVY